MKIGVISDTHGLVREQALDLLQGVDHIIHAGDIGGPEVIERLRAIAPVSVIRGNNDIDAWAKSFPEEQTVALGGKMILILHDLKGLKASVGHDVIISGHSHKPKIETVDGVLYLNPGSAGPRRFKLPISVATLTLDDGAMDAHIHEISI